MANFVITNDETTAQALEIAEFGIVTDGSSLITFGATAITDTGAANAGAVWNDGTIIGNGAIAFNQTSDFSITNSGQMASASTLPVINIFTTGDLDIEIVNHGTIEGLGNLSDAILVQGAGVELINTGSIIGNKDDAFQINGANAVNAQFGASIHNSGLMANTRIGDKAIDLTGLTDYLFNTGTILGNVDMDSGEDSLTNSGLIDGAVELGDDNDEFFGNGGIVTGTVFGEAGDDTFHVDQATVSIDGGSDTDTVIARNDVLDTISVEVIRLRGDGDYQASGDDTTDNDINGNVGDNALAGGGGEDTLRGGAGDDELTGGADKDILVGGSGADVFIYASATDSTVSDSDRIRVFSSGEDLIDLSASAFNNLVFIDDAAFSGTEAELRVTLTAGGTLRAEADVDGDGSADMRIVVTGEASLGADDFRDCAEFCA